MDSRSSRPTQPDTDQQGSFRVKLRVTHVVVFYPVSRDHVRFEIEEARRIARIVPSGSCRETLARLGLFS